MRIDSLGFWVRVMSLLSTGFFIWYLVGPIISHKYLYIFVWWDSGRKLREQWLGPPFCYFLFSSANTAAFSSLFDQWIFMDWNGFKLRLDNIVQYLDLFVLIGHCLHYSRSDLKNTLQHPEGQSGGDRTSTLQTTVSTCQRAEWSNKTKNILPTGIIKNIGSVQLHSIDFWCITMGFTPTAVKRFLIPFIVEIEWHHEACNKPQYLIPTMSRNWHLQRKDAICWSLKYLEESTGWSGWMVSPN